MATPLPQQKKVGAALTGACLLWLCAAGAGLALMLDYKNLPGKAGAPPASWPAGSRLRREEGRATLVVAAHPRCPCTRATVGEVSRLAAQAGGRLRAYVLLLRPAGYTEGWAKTDLWESAAAIPGVSVVTDAGGEEARQFGSATSGQVALYDAEGRLRFSGGITAARGHSGDNAGSDAILSLVTRGAAEQSETRVFGCPLFSPHSECRAGQEADHANHQN
jgi:hypothetical protein